jgi:hypothetical protein
VMPCNLRAIRRSQIMSEELRRAPDKVETHLVPSHIAVPKHNPATKKAKEGEGKDMGTRQLQPVSSSRIIYMIPC